MTKSLLFIFAFFHYVFILFASVEMNRFAKVLTEASGRLQNIKTVSDLAQLLILLRQHEGLFFNNREEVSFLEEVLLCPADLHIARKFLNRRFFTLSQGSPLLLRELGVFQSLLYLGFSVNQLSGNQNLHHELSAPSARLVLNIILTLRSTGGEELMSKSCSLPISSKYFTDYVTAGFVLPRVNQRYWTQIEYSMVDLEKEKVLLSDTFTVLPFVSNSRWETEELKCLALYDSSTGSYVRFKNIDSRAYENGLEQSQPDQNRHGVEPQTKPVLGVEANLINCRKQPILIRWVKNDVMGDAVNEPLLKPLFGSEEYAILPDYYYDSYTLELEENVSSVTLEDMSGNKLFVVGLQG